MSSQTMPAIQTMAAIQDMSAPQAMSTTKAISTIQDRQTSQTMTITQDMYTTQTMSMTQAMFATQGIYTNKVPPTPQTTSDVLAIATEQATAPIQTMISTQSSSTTHVDTASLSTKVRHYLKYNQIQWSRFSSLVLGVSQSRLSTLLSKPQPWHLLTRRVQAMYQRMQLWMDTRATYGNNPYYKQKSVRQAGGRKKKSPASNRPRSLFEMQGNMELLKQLEDFTAAQGLVEGSGGGSQAPGAVVIDQGDVSHGVIEDGEVLEDMQEYNQVMMDMDQTGIQEEEETLATQSEENQEGGDDDSVLIFQEVNQSDLLGCQWVVEDNPDQPGTFKVSIIQVDE